MKIKVETYKPVPLGEYPAILTGAEFKSEGQHGPFIIWAFGFEYDEKRKQITYITSVGALTPKNKLGKTLMGLGEDISDGNEIDLNKYLEMEEGDYFPVLLEIGKKEPEADGTQYNEVLKVLPYNAKKKVKLPKVEGVPF